MRRTNVSARRRIFALLAASVVLVAEHVVCIAAENAPDRSVFLTQRMPYRAFDLLPQREVEIGAATLRVAFAPGELDLDQDTIVAWVRRCAEIVARYYGKYPVADARILVVPVDGEGVPHGTSYGYRGAALKVYVGKSATRAQLDDDWVLVHEMIHFAFPDTDEAHLWFSEGQASYIENIARVQAGARDMRDAWKEIVLNMRKGLPQAGDQGLDHTHTWGRTYWGGALFCLLADIEIHKRTRNRFGLREALRAVVNAGGVTTVHWPLDQALHIADEAVGVAVLSELYDRLKAAPGNIDLEKLWNDLGVAIAGGEIRFDDRAPLADIRRALMTPS